VGFRTGARLVQTLCDYSGGRFVCESKLLSILFLTVMCVNRFQFFIRVMYMMTRQLLCLGITLDSFSDTRLFVYIAQQSITMVNKI